MADWGPPRDLPAAGWYSDPVDAARFRQWTGVRWTHVVFDGTLHQDDSRIEHLPRPTGFPAPELRPARPRRRPWVLGVFVVIGVAVLVIVNTRTATQSRGGASIGGFDANPQATTTTVPPVERFCIERVLDDDRALVDRTLQASNAVGWLDVDHAWSELAGQLAMFGTDQCPVEFANAFSSYVAAVDAFGSYLQDRTGLAGVDDLIGGDDFTEGTSTRVSQMNTRYGELIDIALRYGVTASRRTITYTDGD